MKNKLEDEMTKEMPILAPSGKCNIENMSRNTKDNYNTIILWKEMNNLIGSNNNIY